METRFPPRSHDSPLPPESFRALARVPIHAVLDNLRSAFNVGAVFRTADAGRIAGVDLCGYTASPPNQKLLKTALGTTGAVPWRRFACASDAIGSLRAAGAAIVAIETAPGSVRFDEAAYPRPLALVIGNEALGVSEAAIQRSDFVVHIPMRGFKNSVNVAVAFGIVLFEVLRRWESEGWSLPPDGTAPTMGTGPPR
jgi:23S rRNA (guanosine2251-2'-O)-methyltransferase